MPIGPPTFGRKAAPRDHHPLDQDRGTAASRGYDHRWRKLRTWFLQTNPLCFDCAANGLVTVAKEVHHVKKVQERPDLRLDQNNLLGLCKSCHSARTARGE